MRILLVEPDQVLGRTYKQTLKAAGHKIAWYRSGQAALNAIDQELPDVVVLEVQLGTHNGIEMLYEIRSYPEWQTLPVVIHTLNTAVRDEIFAAALRQLNVSDVLYKPATTSRQLVRAIESVVEHAT